MPDDPAPRVTARDAAAGDLPALGALLHACARHYDGALAPPPAACEAAARAALAGREGTRFALGLLGDAPVGLATYGVLLPGPGAAPFVFLKQLFVREEARSKRVGEALMAHLARGALALGTRLDLTTGADAAAARRFYARLGGEELPKVFVRYEGAALARLAALATAEAPAPAAAP